MGATRRAARLFVVCGACKSGLKWTSASLNKKIDVVLT